MVHAGGGQDGLDGEARASARRRSRGWLGYLLCLLLVAALAAFVYYGYLPLRRAHAELQRRHEAEVGNARALKKQLSEAESRSLELQRSQEQLSGQLEQTLAEKQTVEAELKRIQTELTTRLEPEIKSGDVRIKRRGNELVVDVADQILFDVGQASLNQRGETVLAQVGQALRQLPTYDVQVGGHTDNTRVVSPATQERFPSNWELSTARATNVVRFLQERHGLPGERLIAAGFAEFRPLASNRTQDGRQKNRRIELILVPRAAEGTSP